MSELKFVTEEIKLKVVNLMNQLENSLDLNRQLENENFVLKKELEVQKNTIHTLEESNKIVKLAGTLTDSADDIPALRKKVNEYIREIDECIRFLSERQV